MTWTPATSTDTEVTAIGYTVSKGGAEAEVTMRSNGLSATYTPVTADQGSTISLKVAALMSDKTTSTSDAVTVDIPAAESPVK